MHCWKEKASSILSPRLGWIQGFGGEGLGVLQWLTQGKSNIGLAGVLKAGQHDTIGHRDPAKVPDGMEDAGGIVLDSSRKPQVPPSVLRVDWAQGTLLRQARRILSLSHFLFQGSHPHSHIYTAALPVSPFAQGPLQPSCPSHPSQFCINPFSALRSFTKSITPSFSESYAPEVWGAPAFFLWIPSTAAPMCLGRTHRGWETNS